MQLFAFMVATLWMVGNLILGFWAFYLSFKIESNRLPNRPAMPWRGPTFAFQKSVLDFTENGQMYRSKAIKVEIALFVWAFSVPCLVGIVSGGK